MMTVSNFKSIKMATNLLKSKEIHRLLKNNLGVALVEKDNYNFKTKGFLKNFKDKNKQPNGLVIITTFSLNTWKSKISIKNYHWKLRKFQFK